MFLKMSKRIHSSVLRIDVKIQEIFENMVNLYHLPLRLNENLSSKHKVLSIFITCLRHKVLPNSDTVFQMLNVLSNIVF